MSKLAFILCVALFASAANAKWWSQRVDGARQKVEAGIDGAMTEIKSVFQTAQKKSNEIAEKIEAGTIEYAQEVMDEISGILKETQDEIGKLTGKPDDAACTQMAADLENVAISVISNVSSCVTEKHDLGTRYSENINHISKSVLSDLAALREETHHCHDHVHNVTTAIQAIACSNGAGMKALWITGKAVPELSTNVVKHAYVLSTLQSSLTDCTQKNGLLDFKNQSKNVVNLTKQCIAQKANEFRNPGPEVHTAEISE